jgi:L-arabinokinase
MGLECPVPGREACQRTLRELATFHSVGRFWPSATPSAAGPRNDGHSWSAASAAAIGQKKTSEATARRARCIKALLVVKPPARIVTQFGAPPAAFTPFDPSSGALDAGSILEHAETRMIAVYVSGHGYGHATRTAEVLRAVRKKAPGVSMAVVTSGPESLYRETVPGAFAFRTIECDVGLAQKNALVIDEEATARRCRAFALGHEARVAEEALWLRASGARLVLGDVPPLAFEARRRREILFRGAGELLVGLGYRHLARRRAGLGRAQAGRRLRARDPPAGASVCRRPRRVSTRGGSRSWPAAAMEPRGGGPPAASVCRREHTVRARVVWRDRPVRASPGILGALTGFISWSRDGGGMPANVAATSAMLRYRGHRLPGPGEGGRRGRHQARIRHRLRRHRAGTRIVDTERGDFPEYPILVAEMQRYLPCAHVSNEDLREGRWRPALETVLARPVPPPPALDGAEVAAERLLTLTSE